MFYLSYSIGFSSLKRAYVTGWRAMCRGVVTSRGCTTINHAPRLFLFIFSCRTMYGGTIPHKRLCNALMYLIRTPRDGAINMSDARLSRHCRATRWMTTADINRHTLFMYLPSVNWVIAPSCGGIKLTQHSVRVHNSVRYVHCATVSVLYQP